MSTLISGRDLLALIKENPELKHKGDLATMAGYTRQTRNGDVVPDLNRFTDALLAAKGLAFESETRGRAAANETTVHQNGSILIGSIYAKVAGVGPGDVFSISTNSETGQIVLDVIARAEGSPLPFKVYDRPKKAEATEPAVA